MQNQKVDSVQAFKIARPANPAIPILLSIPHCGTTFPNELISQYKPELVRDPDDTDWFVDQLYGFAGDLGITMISAVYSRWVIDLNRHPESKPLYSDGRIITGLCPTTDFLGNNLYQDNRTILSAVNLQHRVMNYYRPYHEALWQELNELKQKFGKVLLWDCHSIRQIVPTIQKEKFPDLILGDADGLSASPAVIETALTILEASGFTFSHNHPFKGGYITRHYGRPTENVHALQLEMSKVNYMDDAEKNYDQQRAARVQQILKRCLETLHARIFN